MDRIARTEPPFAGSVAPKKDLLDLEAEVVLLRIEFEATRRDTRLSFARLGVRFPPDGLGASSVPPPPMRPEAQSSHDWKAFTEKAVEAVKVGAASKDTTPEEQIRNLIKDEEIKRIEARENARLRADEEKRIAEALGARAARKKAIVGFLKTVVGGVATFGTLELVKFLSTLHH